MPIHAARATAESDDLKVAPLGSRPLLTPQHGHRIEACRRARGKGARCKGDDGEGHCDDGKRQRVAHADPVEQRR